MKWYLNFTNTFIIINAYPQMKHYVKRIIFF